MQVAKRSTDFTARKFPFIFEPQNSTKTTNWTWDALSFISCLCFFFFFSLIVAFQVLPQFARCRSIFCLNFLDLFCSFFVIFSGFSIHHFFFLFYFFRLSHLLWFIWMWGFFQYCFVSFTFCYPLFFQVVSFVLFQFLFFKEDNMFYIHFQMGSPQQWIRAKGSSKSFLTKAPTPPWHHWEQSTHFFHFFGFFIYFMCIYVFIIYLGCFFTILYRFTIFLGFFNIYFFLLDLFLVEIVYQINYTEKKTRKKNAFAHYCLKPCLTKVTVKIWNSTFFFHTSSHLNKIIFLPITMNQKNQKLLFQKQKLNQLELQRKPLQ